jgi:hypothetical protein
MKTATNPAVEKLRDELDALDQERIDLAKRFMREDSPLIKKEQKLERQLVKVTGDPLAKYAYDHTNPADVKRMKAWRRRHPERAPFHDLPPEPSRKKR